MTSTRRKLHIGPLSLITYIAIISLAVLAVLTLTTANASNTLAQRQADATSQAYAEEVCAQTFVAHVDATLSASQATTSTELAQQVNAKLSSSLEAARAASSENVEATASVSGTTVSAQFSCEDGRTLNVELNIRSNRTYDITKWNMAAVVNNAEDDTLWSGASN